MDRYEQAQQTLARRCYILMLAASLVLLLLGVVFILKFHDARIGAAVLCGTIFELIQTWKFKRMMRL